MSNTHDTPRSADCNLTLRVTSEVRDLVLEHVERLRAKNPRIQITLADAHRELLLRGIADAKRSR